MSSESSNFILETSMINCVKLHNVHCSLREWNSWTYCGTWFSQLQQKSVNISCLTIQWSLQFKTSLFNNNSLHFKASYQWHHSYICNINIPPFKTTSDLRPYFSCWRGGLKMQGPLYTIGSILMDGNGLEGAQKKGKSLKNARICGHSWLVEAI